MKKKKRTDFLKFDRKAILCLIFIFAISFVMFYRYIFDLQTSDFPAHIKRSLVGRGYSINLLLFPLFHKLFGSSNIGIVFLMAVFTVATVVATACFLKYFMDELYEKKDLSYWIPWACAFLFICKLSIPEWSPYFYKTSFSTQPWHNSTYIEMRLFAIPALLLYFVIRKDYLKKIEVKKLLLFFLFLFLTNMSKPNFVICFSPVMLAVLIIDFLKSRGKSFKNAFFFGLVVLIACGVLLFQYKVMFPSEGDSSVILSVEHAISYVFSDKKFPLYYLLNFAFPIYVTYLYIKNRGKQDDLSKILMRESWAMNLVSLLVSMFVVETGKRAGDGNFEWGNAFFAYALFMVCLVIVKRMRKRKIISEAQEATALNLFYAQVIMGVFYFGLLLIGYLSFTI